MSISEQTAEEWFAQVATWYTERGRACPKCRRGNAVCRKRTKALLEYECRQCSLLSCRSLGLGNYFVDSGRKRPHVPEPARHSS
jgi:hypothetical protein